MLSRVRAWDIVTGILVLFLDMLCVCALVQSILAVVKTYSERFGSSVGVAAAGVSRGDRRRQTKKISAASNAFELGGENEMQQCSGRKQDAYLFVWTSQIARAPCR